MKKILFIVLLFVLKLSVIAQVSDEDQVRDNFRSYKNYLLESDAEQAVNLLDGHTIKYYFKILELVKNADSAQVASLPLIDKLTVLLTRSGIPKIDILNLTIKNFLMHEIRNGLINKNVFTVLSIGAVEIKDHVAKSSLLINDEATNYYLNFYKEDGNWKFDLTTLFNVNINLLESAVDDVGIQKFIEMQLDRLQAEKQNDNIWEPIINK